jgi:quinol monooxygenase YgiN
MNVMFFEIRMNGENRNAFLSSAAILLENARFESGCVGAQIYEVLQDRGSYCIVGTWLTRLSMERYIRSRGFRKLLLLTEILENPPEIGFFVDAERLGLEYVRKVMEPNGTGSGPPAQPQ